VTMVFGVLEFPLQMMMILVFGYCIIVVKQVHLFK
jgi:short subunit fatty acids transporter